MNGRVERNRMEKLSPLEKLSMFRKIRHNDFVLLKCIRGNFPKYVNSSSFLKNSHLTFHFYYYYFRSYIYQRIRSLLGIYRMKIWRAQKIINMIVTFWVYTEYENEYQDHVNDDTFFWRMLGIFACFSLSLRTCTERIWRESEKVNKSY